MQILWWEYEETAAATMENYLSPGSSCHFLFMQVSWNQLHMSYLLLGQESAEKKSQGLPLHFALWEDVFIKLPDNEVTFINQSIEVFLTMWEFINLKQYSWGIHSVLQVVEHNAIN